MVRSPNTTTIGKDSIKVKRLERHGSEWAGEETCVLDVRREAGVGVVEGHIGKACVGHWHMNMGLFG